MIQQNLHMQIGPVLLAFAVNVSAETCTLEFSQGAILEDVELASTPEAMTAGLSGRESAGTGMLFSWPDSDYRPVWMKATSIELSAAFIGRDGSVQSIIDLEPWSEEIRWSVLPATDMLELARGQFQQYGIDTDSVLIRRDCED